jgi:hypothetical protein
MMFWGRIPCGRATAAGLSTTGLLARADPRTSTSWEPEPETLLPPQSCAFNQGEAGLNSTLCWVSHSSWRCRLTGLLPRRRLAPRNKSVRLGSEPVDRCRGGDVERLVAGVAPV